MVKKREKSLSLTQNNKSRAKTELTRHKSSSALDSETALKSTDQQAIVPLNINNVEHKAACILTNLGNRLLLLKEVSDKSNELRDPLEYKLNFLEKQMFEKNLVLEHLKGSKTTEHNPPNWLSIGAYTAEVEVITKEQEKVKKLFDEKNRLHNIFGGLFPYIPKKLTDTFIEKFNRIFGLNLNDTAILTKLKEDNTTLTRDKINNYCKLFNIDLNKTTKGKEIKKTENELKVSIEKSIIRIIGKKLTKKELSNNKNKIANEDINKLNNQKEIDEKLKELCSPVNIKDLHSQLEKAYPYTIDSEYLKRIEQEQFLVQVRVYKKLGRDMMKSVILLYSGGYETTKIAIPPGINTVLEILPTGATKYLLGELGAYATIADWNRSTLKNYSNFFSHSNVHEKEDKFKSLHQIEAIRNCSALLTNIMFFELAVAKFQSCRNNEKGEWFTYDFDKIADLMPMAMKGAVSGSIWLEQKFFKVIPHQLTHDYRANGEKNKGEFLAQRDNNILFDWLCYKLAEINNECFYTFPIPNNNVSKNIEEYGAKWLNQRGWQQLASSGGYKKDNYIIIVNKQKYIYDNQAETNYADLVITEILQFPLSIFNNLIYKWYKVQLPEPLINTVLSFSLKPNNDIEESKKGKGLEYYDKENPWMEYTREGVEKFLKLRLESIGKTETIVIIPDHIWDGSSYAAIKLANKISVACIEKTLVILNLFNKHWVGLAINKSIYTISINYMDSEQNEIPLILKQHLIKQIATDYPEIYIDFTESVLEPQKYNNCGLEVIENLIAHVTGEERTITQEDALIIHSLLLEDSLSGENTSLEYN